MKKDKIVERIFYHDGTNELVLIRTYPKDEQIAHFLFQDGTVATTRDDLGGDTLKKAGLTFVGHYELSEIPMDELWMLV